MEYNEMIEKEASDAPPYFNAEEAIGWACGYNRAIHDFAPYKEALLKIAFDFKNVSCLAGNPMKWPTTIAYIALGGQIVQGERVNKEEDFKDD
jgi:hypothetical protein